MFDTQRTLGEMIVWSSRIYNAFYIVVTGPALPLPLCVPVDWLWPSLSALTGANLRVWRQDLPELLLHGAGELQGQEPGRGHQETLRTLRPGVEEGGEELHLQIILRAPASFIFNCANIFLSIDCWRTKIRTKRNDNQIIYIDPSPSIIYIYVRSHF